MKRESLPINEIKVEDRQRLDLGDINALAESIKQYGLIQPIVINQEKRLVAGGRRLAAVRSLNHTHIDVVYRETLSVDELHELELEENVRRKNMSWQEEALTVAKIHELKVREGVLNSHAWGQRQTAELFGGINVATVNYTLKVAKLLKHELTLPEADRRGWKCDSIADCWKNVIIRDDQQRLQAELARRAQEEADKKAKETQKVIEGFVTEIGTAPITGNEEDRQHIMALRERAKINYLLLNEQEARSLYFSNPLNPPDLFEKYYTEKREWWTKHLTFEVTQNFYHGDCIEFMNNDENEGRFDHIITDIPYGIDMDMLNQQNPQKDIDTVLEEHDVQSNMSLMKQFFPAAFRCTKDTAFLVTWCDIMQWQYMYDLAVNAGFRVQRWPITWNKTHRCMNQSAQYNFTKSTEIAIVCRKPNAVLVKPAGGCVVSASNEEARRKYAHPFAKPAEIWDFILEYITLEGQTILEPFAGRGSGVIPMLRAKRKVIGVELNDAHYNALIENVKTYYLSLNPNLILS